MARHKPYAKKKRLIKVTRNGDSPKGSLEGPKEP